MCADEAINGQIELLALIFPSCPFYFLSSEQQGATAVMRALVYDCTVRAVHRKELMARNACRNTVLRAGTILLITR